MRTRAAIGMVGVRWGTASVLALGMFAPLGGCETDSYLDPSVVGRWEHTPTIVPVLERISSIEPADDDFVEVSQVTADDLIPFAALSLIGPGDQLEVTIREFERVGGPAEPLAVQVDQRGNIDLPRLGVIRVAGLSASQAREVIATRLEEAGLFQPGRAVVSVTPQSQRKQTVNVIGAVQNPGTYFIPSPEYRLLEALSAAGGFTESVPYIYVIRQVPLTDAGLLTPTEGRPAPATDGAPPAGGERPVEGERLIDLIDELSPPSGDRVPPREGAPGAVPDPAPRDPAAPEETRPARPDEPAPGLFAQPETPRGSQPPPIDLVDDPREVRRAERGDAAASEPPARFTWMYVGGQWVKVAAESGREAGGDVAGRDLDELVTQRVLEIPTAPLVQGAAKYNIIVRPGDVIRVPNLTAGLFYIEGAISRGGTFDIPPSGSITLMRAVAAAGGLSTIAIPERVDLVRMVGDRRQAMIRLNLRAIMEGTQPDVYLKPDDLINIGTNFWAYPLAVIRGGLRASYGFGFLLDRNFGNDVFGAPPVNAQGF